MRSCLLLWAAAFSAVRPISCAAGAFLQPPGQGLVIVTTAFAGAHKAYDGRGRLVETTPYDKFETRLYAEYGLLEQLTLVVETDYMSFRGSPSTLDELQFLTAEARAGAPLLAPPDSRARYAGIGSGWLGGRLRLLEWGATVVSLQASLRAATAQARVYLDMKERLQEDARIQIGWPVELFWMKGFADTQIGYRTAGQSGGELRADGTLGLRPMDDLLLLAQSFTVIAPGDGFGAGFMSQKFQLSGVYDLTEKIAGQVGVFAAARGVNESAERGVLGALWYRF